MENKNKKKLPRWFTHGTIFGIEAIIYGAMFGGLLTLFLFVYLVTLFGIINNPYLISVIQLNPWLMIFLLIGFFVGIFLTVILVDKIDVRLIKSPLRKWPKEGIVKRYEKEFEYYG